MSWFHRLILRFRSTVQGTEFESEMDDELRFHLESMIQENIRAGMRPDEARRNALLTFGGLDKTKEECRDTRWTRFVEDLWRDLHYSFRLLIKDRSFTAVAVLTLGLGIGANTAIFSVVHAVLLRPMPYENPNEIVVFEDHEGSLDTIAPPYFRGLQERNRVFQELAMFEQAQTDLTAWGEPEILKGAHVSASFFAVLRMAPACGRGFTQEEDRPRSAPVVVLGNGLWRRRFGGDASILGKSVRLSDKLHTIIGVMPSGFAFPNDDTEIWTPFNVENPESYDQPADRAAGFNTIARLKTGVTPALAEENVNSILAQLSTEYPTYPHETHARVTKLHQHIVGEVRPALLILLGAVSFVLLVACTNVANLTFIHAEGRRKEMAIRVALGAKRKDLIRQSLTESLLVSLFGCGLGLFLAQVFVGMMVRLAPRTIPRLDQIGLSGPVLVFTVAATIFTTLVSGLFPALKSSKADLNDSMKDGWSKSSAGTGRAWVRDLLVVCQLTLAVVLLIGASLMVRTFVHLFEMDLGFDPRHVLTMRLDLPYRESSYRNRNQRAVYLREVCDRLGNLPGVESVALTNALPFSWSAFIGLAVDGHKDPEDHDLHWADLRFASPKYFQVMRIPILRGREFRDLDYAESPGVIIIDQTLARRMWPSLDDPVGKKLRAGKLVYTVVGVVANVRAKPLGRPINDRFSDTEQAYLPSDQRGTALVIRTRVTPLTLVDPIRREVWRLDANQAISEVSTMEKRVSDFTSVPRFYMALFISFAVLAVVLAATGIYGVISYSVTTRTHEIGVRIALGAERRDVIWMVLGGGVTLVLIGLTIGLTGACSLSRLLISLVYEVQPNDPVAFITVSLLFAMVSLLACYMPARTATRVDPMVALRYE